MIIYFSLLIIFLIIFYGSKIYFLRRELVEIREYFTSVRVERSLFLTYLADTSFVKVDNESDLHKITHELDYSPVFFKSELNVLSSYAIDFPTEGADFYRIKNKCGTETCLMRKWKLLQNKRPVYGCCSDFVETFIIYSSINNIKARELGNKIHSFCEFLYRGKWIFFDPQFKIYAIDSVSGQLLSTLEILKYLELDLPLEFKFISSLNIEQKNQLIRHLYAKNSFDKISINPNSNIAQFEFIGRYLFENRILSFLVLLITGNIDKKIYSY